MSVYYSAIVYLCWVSLGVLCLLVHENDRLDGRDKKPFYLTFALIALSALAEYCGVLLDGRAELPSGMLRFVKCADYILTPMAGGALVLLMRLKNRWKAVLEGLLVFNTVMQLASAFGGWMVTIDAQNHYRHGPLYPLYAGIYLSIILIVLIQLAIYGNSFRRQNRASLYAIIFLVISGIVIQELVGKDARTSYLALTIGAMLLYIHYTEFVSLKMDDNLRFQQHLIDTDALTGVFSRSAYSRVLKSFDLAGALPDDLAVFSIDINELKHVNDSMGHEAGDELIRGAASCIVKALDAGGKCYRTGGDEFIVLTAMDREAAGNALVRLKQEADRWHGDTVRTLSLSAGFALAKDYAGSGISVEMLVKKSDEAMYQAKAAYYRQQGNDRRKRR